MEKTLVRLGQIEGMLITSRPVGGLPESAKEQLERFMVGWVLLLNFLRFAPNDIIA